MEVTVITPIAPHHEDLFPRCMNSVNQQTVPVRHLHMVDHKKRGPGYIRNRLLEQVQTEYVVFLDADDYLEPTFIEECLAVVEPDGYVFTDWYQAERICSQKKGKFWETALHLITCLIHTDMIRAAGGFDENLTAMEDTDLFLKFDTFAYCGTKLAKPLVHYTNQGKRGVDAHKNDLIRGIKKELVRRYNNVGCCSDDNNIGPRPAVGKRLPDDVQVVALWVGNQVTGGAVSGRRYPRASRPMKLWVDPRDARLRPDLYRVIKPKKKVVKKVAPKPAPPEKKTPPRGGGNTFGDMLLQKGVIELPPEAPLPVASGKLSPDFNVLNSIAQRIYS